jgi:hypothetical protein
MSLPPKARIHCAVCAITLTEPVMPEGRLMADPSDPEYHLAHFKHLRGYMQGIAVCGKDVSAYEIQVGTYGIDLRIEDVLNAALMPYAACPRCFAHVW